MYDWQWYHLPISRRFYSNSATCVRFLPMLFHQQLSIQLYFYMLTFLFRLLCGIRWTNNRFFHSVCSVSNSCWFLLRFCISVACWRLSCNLSFSLCCYLLLRLINVRNYVASIYYNTYFYFYRRYRIRKMDQTLVNSSHGLLICEIGGLVIVVLQQSIYLVSTEYTWSMW